jgi:hypothetical protein
VSETGQELLDLLAKGRDLDLHVRYEAPPVGPDTTTPTDATAAGTITMELWRSDGQVRQDLLLAGPNVRNEVSAFQRPSGNAVCQRATEADWICNAARSTATENGDPVGIIEAAAANLAGAEVTVTDATILDTAVKCFAIEGGGAGEEGDPGASTLCVSDEGIPMRIAVSGQELSATVVERTVDPKAFDLPAEISPIDS